MEGYAPPALASRYFNTWENILEPDEEDLDPWWTLDPAEQDVEVDIKALVRQKGHAEELSDITTPKVSRLHTNRRSICANPFGYRDCF